MPEEEQESIQLCYLHSKTVEMLCLLLHLHIAVVLLNTSFILQRKSRPVNDKISCRICYHQN